MVYPVLFVCICFILYWLNFQFFPNIFFLNTVEPRAGFKRNLRNSFYSEQQMSNLNWISSIILEIKHVDWKEDYHRNIFPNSSELMFTWPSRSCWWKIILSTSLTNSQCVGSSNRLYFIWSVLGAYFKGKKISYYSCKRFNSFFVFTYLNAVISVEGLMSSWWHFLCAWLDVSLQPYVSEGKDEYQWAEFPWCYDTDRRRCLYSPHFSDLAGSIIAITYPYDSRNYSISWQTFCEFGYVYQAWGFYGPFRF
jgi:hypothetical protein